ncbi:MAG: DUF4175 family protein [Thermoanaerobaculia bacterium]
MTHPKGFPGLLDEVAARWRRRRLALSVLLVGIAVAPLEVILLVWARVPAWWLPAAAAAALATGWLALRHRPGTTALVRHLDRSIADLEESSDLLLAPDQVLTPLARLQKSRVLAVAEGLTADSVELGGVPGRSLWRLAALGAAACAAIWLAAPGSSEPVGPAVARRPATGLAVGWSLSAEVRPPDYTGLDSSVESISKRSFDLVIAQGSTVTWSLSGLAQGSSAKLVFDDGELGMQPEGEVLSARRSFKSTRLYFVSIAREGGQVERTGYARVQVIPDQPPEVRVSRPEPFLLLPEEGADRLVVTAEVSDDYSVESTALVATVASGTGELVEFRERRFRFPRSDGNTRRGEHARVFDLAALGVVPGSELYFYVEALDNRLPSPNRGRSATHVVRRSGGPSASIDLGAGIPGFAVPDLFRSQRQIILDTERLLKEEPSMSIVEFERRSEEIGFDQRALRMRYGALLGQEFVDGRPLTEEEEALDFEDDEDLGELVGSLPEGVVHEHDPQDLNTFFDSEVRERMRAALNEMWGAEGRLRSNEPRPALPFEYRALTLLKEAQERSRVYVQKVGFEAPPLYPDETRLTGDLSGVRARRAVSRTRAPARPLEDSVIDDLDRIEVGELVGRDAELALRSARRLLLRGALELASSDLAALEAAAELEAQLAAGRPLDVSGIERVRRELWRRLPDPERQPGRSEFRTSPPFERYLDALAEGGEPGR